VEKKQFFAKQPNSNYSITSCSYLLPNTMQQTADTRK